MQRTALQPLQRALDLLLLPVATLGALAVVLELGFALEPAAVARARWVQHAAAAYLVAAQVLRLAAAAAPAALLHRQWGRTLLAAGLLGWLAWVAVAAGGVLAPHPGPLPPALHLALRGFQGLVVVALLTRLVSLYRLVAYLRVHPAQVVLLSFLGAVVVGAGLLMLPQASTAPGSLGFLTALFTATSAVCVTGLVVVDTGTAFTPLGQGILLGLFQLGGLGIMTVTSHFALYLGGSLGVREGVVVQEALGANTRQQTRRLVQGVLAVTLLFEAAGALVWYAALPAAPAGAGPRWFQAVFHAVSAFCNAGFALYADSLRAFADRPWILSATMVLIVAGGLGFPALLNLYDAARHQLRREPARVHVLSVQTRLALIMTAVLIAAGLTGVLLVEADGALAGRDRGGQVLGAAFLSVTARTAGFNTVDVQALAPASVFLLLALMFIGACPGGTGGGIRTTTFAVVTAHLLAAARGRGAVVLFQRAVPEANVLRALAVFALAAALVSGFIFALALAEPSQPLLDLVFEVFSAFGTVGLSRGVTPELSAAGRWIIIAAMFVGRLGSLTFLYAIVTHPRRVRREYPSESVMVG